MKTYFLILFLFTFALSAKSLHAANVYIDPSAQYNGNGSKGTPAQSSGSSGAYNTWEGIKFEPSNDYFQKCGTSYTFNYVKDIIVSGNSSNEVEIGAYYLKNDLEFIGIIGKKPIIRKNDDKGYLFNIYNSNWIRIKDCDLRGGYCCIAVTASSHITITNCEIGNGSNRLGVLVRGYKIDEKYIESNYGIITDCNINPIDLTKGLDDGIKMREGSSYWKISNNIIKNWGHTAIYLINQDSNYLNGVCYNKIYNNKITAPDKEYCRGIGTDGSDSAKCSYNEFFNNIIIDTSVRNQFNGSYNIFHHNVIFNVWNSSRKTVGVGEGIDLEAYSEFVCHHNKIYNNLIANCAEAGIRLYHGSQQKQHNEIINNIIYNCGHNSINILDGISLRDAGLVVADHANVLNNIYENNCIFSAYTHTPIAYRGLKITVEKFNNKNGTNFDVVTNNIGSNPQLIESTKSILQISAISPCINSGKEIPFRSDFFSITVPSGKAFDIGHVEYQYLKFDPPTSLRLVSDQ